MSEDRIDRIFSEISLLREQQGRIETRVKLINRFQNENNKKVDRIIMNHDSRIIKMERAEIFRQGFASCFGFVAGIMGTLVSKFWG